MIGADDDDALAFVFFFIFINNHNFLYRDHVTHGKHVENNTPFWAAALQTECTVHESVNVSEDIKELQQKDEVTLTILEIQERLDHEKLSA